MIDWNKYLEKIPGFRPPKDLRKLLTEEAKYVVFLRIDQRLFIIKNKVRKVEEHYLFKWKKWTLAVLDKHRPFYWKDYTVICVNGSDLTDAPFMPEDHIDKDKHKSKAFTQRAIRWMKEHCRPIIAPTKHVVKEDVRDGEKFLIKGEYKKGDVIGYDMTIVEFPGFDAMKVSNESWWADNFNFGQEMEDNRLFQFLHMFAMSLADRLKLFLQDTAIILLLLLLAAMINPDFIRIGAAP